MKRILVIITAMTLATAGCAKKEEPAPKEPPAAKEADQVQHKVMAFNLEGLTEKGAKKWDVQGKSAAAVSENEVRLDSIVANAYGEEGAATITADKGVYDRANNNVRLEQNVKATIENVKSFGGDMMDISGMVKSSGQTKEAKPDKDKKTKTVITCDGEVLFDYEQNHAYFNKNVKVVSEDGDIDADKISVNLDPATKRVTEIIAEGSVKIARGENITYSDKATYVEAEKKIVLTGRPKLVIYQEGGLEGALSGPQVKTEKR